MSDYPVDALPEVVRNAVVELSGRIQAPWALISTCCLSAVAAAAQAGTKVLMPTTNTLRTVGMFFLVIAESGERKSTVDQLVFKPLQDADQAQAGVYAEELHRSKAPDGHPKLLHLWPVKLLQAGRSDGDYTGVAVMREAASFKR